VGDTVKLTVAAVAVGDASGSGANPTVRWSSSNTGAATVTATGLVTAVAPGSATITATSNGRSGAATITVAPRPPPGTVEDLTVDAVTDSSVSLAFTEVTDGGRRPAAYDVRYAATPISWGRATSVSQGTCATPLEGTVVGATRRCTVLGLTAGTDYDFQLVAFRGALNANAVFGDLSNIATGTTAPSTAPVASVAVALGTATITATSEGKTGSAAISVVASPPPVTYYRTNFNDGTPGPLTVYAYGGGSCAKSTAYTDSGSAYGMQCTIPAGTGAAALEAWFGEGHLATLPKDPTLDQD